MGTGGTSGMVTDESETLRLDNLESEVVGGARGITTSGCVIARNIAQFSPAARRKPEIARRSVCRTGNVLIIPPFLGHGDYHRVEGSRRMQLLTQVHGIIIKPTRCTNFSNLFLE